MFSSQLNQVFSQVFGHDPDVARAHRLDRGLGQGRGVDIPLVGQPGLDHHARAVAIRELDDPVLDPVEMARPLPAARRRACAPRSGRGRSIRPGSGRRRSGRRAPRASSMLSISAGLKPARLPTSKSLKSWPGVILTAPEPSSGSACSSATIGTSLPVIGRRTLRADQLLVALVVGMDRDRHVGEHRLGPRGGDVDHAASRPRADSANARNGPAPRAVSTSRSEMAVPNFGSQLTSRLSR